MTAKPTRRRALGAALAAGLAVLGGCGRKGPLYFPEETEKQEESEKRSGEKTSQGGRPVAPAG